MGLGALQLLSGILYLVAVAVSLYRARESGLRLLGAVLALNLSLLGLLSFALSEPSLLGRSVPWEASITAFFGLILAALILLGAVLTSREFGNLTVARKRVESLLAESQANAERFQTIFENIPDGAFLHDSSGVLLDCNRRALELIGYEADEVIGRNLLDLHIFSEENLVRVSQYLAGVRLQNAGEYSIRRKDGTVVPVEARSFPVTLGGTKQVVVSARDLTERKQAEERILSLGRLVDQSVNEVYVIDFATLRFLRVNDGACRNLGYSVEELTGLTADSVVPDLDDPEFLEILGPLLVHGAPLRQINTSHRRKDGSMYPVQSHVQRSQLFGREVIVVFSIDLTEQEAVYAELRRSQAQLSEAQRVGRLGSWVWQVHEGTLEWSDEVYNVTGISRGDFDGTLESWLTFIPLDDRENLMEHAMRLVTQGGRLAVDHRIVPPNGEMRYVQEVGEVSASGDGQAVTVVGTIFEVTARKQAERALQSLNSELEDRVAARTSDLEAAIGELEAFSYSVSHDLRQPLRSLNGYVHMIEEDGSKDFDDVTRGYFARIVATADRMSEMIDGLLLLARIGRTDLGRETVDLTQLVTGMFEELREAEPSCVAEIELEPSIEALGDPRLLDLLLRNLTGNAWKFSATREPRRIHFDVNVVDGERVYSLRDNGVGFNMDFEEKLFGAFQRLHRADEFPGTGIGLATAERIVRQHGGRIWAEGEEEQGATFFFTLGKADRASATAISSTAEKTAENSS
ncbi:MAG: PAS domain S-box-containing protein [Hyphomicrobiaceae bacterium]